MADPVGGRLPNRHRCPDAPALSNVLMMLTTVYAHALEERKRGAAALRKAADCRFSRARIDGAIGVTFSRCSALSLW